MNKELEDNLKSNATLLGYKTLVKAIRNCDEKVQEQINTQYNAVISNLYSE